MKSVKPNAGTKYGGFHQTALLFLTLVLLFGRSFSPDYVLFSNDGPLGQQNASYAQLPSGYTGMWDDLNDTGYSAGVFSPSITTFIKLVLGPLGYAKFYAPIALFILGLGAWSFFRSLKLSPLAAALGALAIFLSATFFAGACWGVASAEIAVGMDFFALALVAASTSETPWQVRLTRFALAGLCIGMNVIEAADIGALCSIFVALFIFYKSIFDETGNLAGKIIHGVGRVAMVAAFAGFIALQTILMLVGTSITGIAGTGQDTESKQAHWDWATQFSLPKKETLGFVVPGLFGYKQDTPKDMAPEFHDAFRNGVYWGGVGRDPAIDRFFDSGGEGNPPAGGMRFGYGGYYCGILVVLIAIWAIAQSFRRQNSLFSAGQKRFVWFWTAIMFLSLLFAWGRFAPMFYGLLYYKLPFFSTIRNPAKFIIFFCWALVVLFAYGVDMLNRRYLDSAGPKPSGLLSWWKKAGSFDRKWTFACGMVVAASVIGWMIYGSQMPEFIHYLQKVGFPNDDPTADNSATAVAAFSLHQVTWFVGLVAVAAGLVVLTVAGCFSGPRANIGAVLLGGFLIFDLGRADLPWVTHWDYKQKYEVGTLNPVLDFLRQQPYEHRVAALPFEPQQQLRAYDYLFGGSGIYRIEWAQHHFPYYDIQSLDLIQMSRTPEDIRTYEESFFPQSQAEYPLIARRWELSNTRYLLGAAGFLNVLNQLLDPAHDRFRIAQRFDIVTKPGVTNPTELEQFTAVTNSDGDLALFEFTGALPRAKLYGNWLVNTNDQVNLKKLADLNFDPSRTVLISTPQTGLSASATNENSGTVEFKSYSSKDIVFDAKPSVPSVLLLNDKYDPQWHVAVDGRPAELLRCNFLMRGVYLQPGEHTVEFHYSAPTGPLYVTLAGLAVAIALGALLWLMTAGKAGKKTA